MPEILRTFIAIEVHLPESVRTILGQLRELGPALKTVDENTTHVTLKFLGDTPVDVLPEIQKSLASVGLEFKAFDVELRGIGAFPHWGRPAVIWVGLVPQEPLLQIAERLEAEIEPLGFPKESRAFHPHLTLARIKAKPPRELKALAEANEHTSLGTQTIDRVILYKSVLQKSGPVYTPLATVALSGSR